MKKNYLAIIPARGGSVRLKNKNIIDLGGKPLIAYTIEAAQRSGVFTQIIVSTDSQAIADVAIKYRIKVSTLRPQALATAEADVMDVLAYELRSIVKSSIKEEIIALLQPTSPFRSAEDIKKAVNLFDKSDADTLTAVVESKEHPYWMWKDQEHYIVPYYDYEHVQMGRSLLPTVYSENGAIYLTKRSLIEDKHALYGSKIIPYVMSRDASVDIDTPDDLLLAKFILSQPRE